MIKKELAEGQLYPTLEKHQTTREAPDQYTNTRPSVMKKKLACKRSIRPQGNAQTSKQKPNQVRLRKSWPKASSTTCKRLHQVQVLTIGQQEKRPDYKRRLRKVYRQRTKCD